MNQLPAQLDRFWTQEPALFEDALGRVTPIRVEFLENWEVSFRPATSKLFDPDTMMITSKAFDAVLEVRFRQCPGHRKIQHKEYALRVKSTNRDIDRSTAFNCTFLPGRHLDMSMIFDDGSGSLSSCPGCKTVTAKTDEELNLQVQWYVFGDHLDEYP